MTSGWQLLFVSKIHITVIANIHKAKGRKVNDANKQVLLHL